MTFTRVAVVLNQIQRRAGLVSPQLVVSEARKPSSPLNKYFEWDDSLAAEKFREVQAGRLIRSVYVISSDAPNSPAVRAFVNIKESTDASDDEAPSIQGYVGIVTTLTRPDLQSQVLAYAREQLVLWRKKFGGYKEFYEVVRVIDESVK